MTTPPHPSLAFSIRLGTQKAKNWYLLNECHVSKILLFYSIVAFSSYSLIHSLMLLPANVAFASLFFLSLSSQKPLFFPIPSDIFSHLIPELPKPLNFLNSAPTLLLIPKYIVVTLIHNVSTTSLSIPSFHAQVND